MTRTPRIRRTAMCAIATAALCVALAATTALLNKINAATVVNLRTQQANTQLLAHTLEQLLVESKRKRDAEVDHLNADIYLRTYARDFARRTNARTAEILTNFRLLR